MEIKKEHIKPNLLKLLEENNCVEAFLENTNNAYSGGKQTLNVINGKDNRFGQLLCAFDWENSPEGQDFWDNIDEQLPND